MKNVIIASFMLFCSSSFAQQHATTYTNCQLEVEAILLQQSFDIDEPVSEEARYIFFEMYEELNTIYQLNANDPSLAPQIAEFEETLQKAADLNLNISMFQQDIDQINALNP